MTPASTDDDTSHDATAAVATNVIIIAINLAFNGEPFFYIVASPVVQGAEKLLPIVACFVFVDAAGVGTGINDICCLLS